MTSPLGLPNLALVKKQRQKWDKRGIGFGILLTYVYAVVFGSFAHNLLHHYDDVQHHHSLPCLAEGLNETSTDTSLFIGDHSAVQSADCGFLQGLRDVNRPNITSNSAPLLTQPIFFGILSTLRSPRIWFSRPSSSLFSTRGPPMAIVLRG